MPRRDNTNRTIFIKDTRNLNRIIDILRNEQLTLFVGAGFSRNAGAPSCWDICQTIIKTFPEDEQADLQGKRLDELSNIYVDEHDGNKDDLIRLIEPLFNFERKDLTDHINLSNIPHIHKIITTNYDTLLEETYGERCQVIASNNDVVNIDQTKDVHIFKIHGDFNHPNDILITESDYFDFYRNPSNPLLWDVVRSELAQNAIAFIGYSLSDDNIQHILDRISEQTTSERKRIFLISPALPKHQLKKLIRMNVEYVQAYGNTFLKNTIDCLKKNIHKDIRKGRISTKIMHQFCQYHGLDVEIRSNFDQNEIIKAFSNTGERDKVHFTVDKVLPKIINNIGLHSNTSITIAQDVMVPAIKFNRKDVKNYSHTLNGITLQDQEELSSIIISPSVEECSFRLIVPSAKLNEKLQGFKYSPKENTAVIQIKTPVGILEIEIFLDEDTNIFTTNISLKDPKSYLNLNAAIHWMQALIDIWSGKKFKISGLINFNEYQTVPESQLHLTCFPNIIEYLDNLREIECSGDIEFSEYSVFTEDNLRKSRIVRAFLLSEPISSFVPINSEISFQMRFIRSDKIPQYLSSEEYPFGILMQNKEQLTLCGHSFDIPYQYDLFPRCKFKEKIILSKDEIAVKISLLETNFYSYYTDKEDPDFIPGYELIKIGDPLQQ